MNINPMEFERVVRIIDGNNIDEKWVNTIAFTNKIMPINPDKVVGTDSNIVVAPMNILDPNSNIEIRTERSDEKTRDVFRECSCIGKIPVKALDAVLLKISEIEKLKIKYALGGHHFNEVSTQITCYPKGWNDFRSYKAYDIVDRIPYGSNEIIDFVNNSVYEGAHDEADALRLAVLLQIKADRDRDSWFQCTIINDYKMDSVNFWNQCRHYLSENENKYDKRMFLYDCLVKLHDHHKLEIETLMNNEMIAFYNDRNNCIYNESFCWKSKNAKSVNLVKRNALSISYSAIIDRYIIELESFAENNDIIETIASFDMELTAQEIMHIFMKACKIRDCMMEISFLEAYKHACSLKNKNLQIFSKGGAPA